LYLNRDQQSFFTFPANNQAFSLDRSVLTAIANIRYILKFPRLSDFAFKYIGRLVGVDLREIGIQMIIFAISLPANLNRL
jgi:hypothetical protein